MIKIVLIAGTLFCSMMASAESPDYREEIMRYVITPCHEQILIRQGYTKEGNLDAMVALLAEMSVTEIEHAMAATIPAVTGRPLNERVQVYRFALENCVRASLGPR
ncbi:MAG: hypothetical protein OXC42_00070 [Gammaproteobacteria bacterium]|nr:hypothetical protein [Gammaproteobacteria bacterium]